MGRQITDGTRLIVFDMEWNQPIGGMEYSFPVSELPGEIIEIGAVAFTYSGGVLRKNAVFTSNIKPKRYTKLHYHVKKVTHKTTKDLLTGEPFEVSYERFRKFCGENAILVGWGDSDPDMLKKNLKFFGMDSELKMDFLDLQPVFSVLTDDITKQRSVEYAVDYFNISKVVSFHSAMNDANYTGEILRMLYKKNGAQEVNEAISKALVNPDVNVKFQFVGSEADTIEAAISESTGFGSVCPICGKNFEFEFEPFRIRKNTYAMPHCPDDGTFFVRIRAKKAKNEKWYAAAVMRRAAAADRLMMEVKHGEYEEFGSEGAPVPQKTAEEDEEQS